METLSEIRTNILKTTREEQLNTVLANQYINLTLMEINDPGWAFEATGQKGYHHLWSFNKRKWTLTTVASTEDYVLPRDVDKIALVRQTNSPTRMRYLPDDVFYAYEPYPTASGDPQYYRIWEEEGISTRLSADGTIDVVSSSASDITQTVSVVGRSTDGFIQSETYTLNGTTKQSGSKTFDSAYPIKVSKSAATTGNVTVTTGATSLLVMGPEERSPRFKVISFYPIPSSAITVYFEYYTRLRKLVNESDVPNIDEKWLWVLRLGAISKIYQMQPSDLYAAAQAQFAAGVRSMVKADMTDSDYIPVLRSQNPSQFIGRVKMSDSAASGFYGGGYGLAY